MRAANARAPAPDASPLRLGTGAGAVAAATRLLCPGGWLLIEVGGEQDEALGPDLAAPAA